MDPTRDDAFLPTRKATGQKKPRIHAAPPSSNRIDSIDWLKNLSLAGARALAAPSTSISSSVSFASVVLFPTTSGSAGALIFRITLPKPSPRSIASNSLAKSAKLPSRSVTTGRTSRNSWKRYHLSSDDRRHISSSTRQSNHIFYFSLPSPSDEEHLHLANIRYVYGIFKRTDFYRNLHEHTIETPSS